MATRIIDVGSKEQANEILFHVYESDRSSVYSGDSSYVSGRLITAQYKPQENTVHVHSNALQNLNAYLPEAYRE